MTAGIRPVSAPHGKGFYIAVAAFASLWGFAFVWAAFALRSLVLAGIAALFLIGAMQAFERWLAPGRALARSAAISDVARARLLGLHNVLLAMGVALSMIDVALRAFWGGHFGYITVSFGVFFFAGYLVADLCGERR